MASLEFLSSAALPILNFAKSVNINSAIWVHLLEKGGKLLKSWKDMNPGPWIKKDITLAIRNAIFGVLKSILLLLYWIAPPLPMPKLTRDEFNAYKKTLVQDHIYEFIFHESDSQCSTATSSPQLSPLSTVNEGERNEELIREIEPLVLQLISQVSCIY